MREEEYLKQNAIIKEAIHADREDHNKDNYAKVIGSVGARMHADSSFLVPVEFRKGEKESMLIRILNGQDGRKALGVFTDGEEAKKKNPTDLYAMPIAEILSYFLENEELDAVLINPWGEPFPLVREAVKNLLDYENKVCMPYKGIKVNIGDITNLSCSAIVNSADPLFAEGDGVDHAIYQKAGNDLMKLLDLIGSCKMAEEKLTPAFNLPQRFIMHTVGPVWSGDDEEKDCENLKACYTNCLNEAKKHKLRSIAFPAISCGASGFPMELGAKVAVEAVLEWLTKEKDYAITVIFDLVDQASADAYVAVLPKAGDRDSVVAPSK